MAEVLFIPPQKPEGKPKWIAAMVARGKEAMARDLLATMPNHPEMAQEIDRLLHGNEETPGFTIKK